jgi:hypothetical protein
VLRFTPSAKSRFPFREPAALFFHALFQRLFLGDALPIDLRYRAHTNEVLGSFDIRLNSLAGWKGKAQTAMNLTTQDSRPYRRQDHREVASGRLDPDDLARFEGEGGPEVPEPAAPEPPELLNKPKQKLKTSCHEL